MDLNQKCHPRPVGLKVRPILFSYPYLCLSSLAYILMPVAYALD
jgi:hypothetical protein